MHASSSSSRSLADRIITAPTYMPITLKPVTIDFSQYIAANLTRIFALKFAATLKRFNVLKTLDCLDVINKDIKTVFKPRDCTVKNEIGRISFKGLWHN
ncbi:uncharacterized protein PHACADRAFT_198980 [Phanerochaete carnosa HHB-10118-sp]|uniref:Uncharacterized protein n=1 Tax=Phanerochaete carnosa (strain HHB-10118-sp) TaxID=650164 RepID=K5WME9_PHACS|nr:uncharacterized protein PHACADRAFT_198980 [Phanerochaete carnosa HHB-10118-sp]EKM51472.1 hypothetical protein PHACADRAFT_198980 [Phanerochaete carnosa HHB-10118-sp]